MKRLILCAWVACVWVVGCSSLPTEKRSDALPDDLLADSAWTYSIDEGATFTEAPPFMTTAGQVVDMISRVTFDVESVEAIEELHLHADLYSHHTTMTLNGTPILRAYPELGYTVIRGIDPAILKSGTNELRIVETWKKYDDGKDQLPPTSGQLVPMAPSDLAFRTGPVLGAFTEDQFAITCRTNMVAKVICRARPIGGGETVVIPSSYGLMHEFVIPREGAYEYQLTAELDGATCRTEWQAASDWADVTDGSLRFVVSADSQTENPAWNTITAMMVEQDPDLLIMTGDMVSNGRHDAQWDAQFFDAARELVAETPLYPVQGNHEMESPILDDLFYTPADRGRGLTWAQQIGDVQFISIFGLEDYSVGSENYAWVEKTLAESDAKFIFLLSHYPAWASGHAAKIDPDEDPPAYQSRFVLMPLLARYDATALVAGHWHSYERSEPPEGVTSIVNGGGGGGLDKLAADREPTNPYSKAYAEAHHYLLFDVEGDTCTMQAIGLDGEVIDTRTWDARVVVPVVE
jgi:predicted phosphodiesterase